MKAKVKQDGTAVRLDAVLVIITRLKNDINGNPVYNCQVIPDKSDCVYSVKRSFYGSKEELAEWAAKQVPEKVK